MGLSREFIEAHIEKWSGALNGGYYAHRAKWPARLFHHTPIENAADILAQNELLSRTASELTRKVSVADADVVSTRTRAHEFCRLYFRPRTPTQYHIEGIRRPSEYYHGATHAPTLVMFVFDARAILGMPNVRFSDGNMQALATQDGDSEVFFNSIEFEKVFHEGPFGGGQHDIIVRRCAEVLAPSPLPLQGTLEWIYCRSHAERMFLLQKGGEAAKAWEKRILVSDDLRVFEKRYTYVERVGLSATGVLLWLAPRSDGADVEVEVFSRSSGQCVLKFSRAPLRPFPPQEKKCWRIGGALSPDTYFVRVQLEGCLAFEGEILNQEDPF